MASAPAAWLQARDHMTPAHEVPAPEIPAWMVPARVLALPACSSLVAVKQLEMQKSAPLQSRHRTCPQLLSVGMERCGAESPCVVSAAVSFWKTTLAAEPGLDHAAEGGSGWNLVRSLLRGGGALGQGC